MKRIGLVSAIFCFFVVLASCGGGGGNGSGGTAERRADVIIAIDSSASMATEIAFVETEINNFASSITLNGVDLRTILIVEGGAFCATAPLGSGTCPADENLPSYRHDPTTVSSNNAFDQIIASYSNWNGSLRSDASKTIIVVTDDDSGSTWEQFRSDLIALDATFTGFRFHAFAATVGPPLLPTDFCYGLSASVGTEYIDLTNDTGGEFNDLCNQSFNPGFVAMAAAVINDTP